MRPCLCAAIAFAASAYAVPQTTFSSEPAGLTMLPPPTNAWQPSSIVQSIDLGCSLTRLSTVYVLKDVSIGDKAKWTIGIPGQEGFIEAVVGKAAGKKAVEVIKLGRGKGDVTYYTIAIPSLAASSSGLTVTINTVVAHTTTPFPPELPQTAESIGMSWTADLLDAIASLDILELERVDELKVKVKTPTPRLKVEITPEFFVESHTSGSATVTYTSKGKLARIGPQIARILYQQPEPILSMRKLDRLVEVSHWGGNLAVQDKIELVNSGPKLQGHFARIEHQKIQMTRRNSASAVSALTIALPPRVHSPYYVDMAGNVSTSNFRPSSPSNQARLPSQRENAASASVLELRPRYPLLGGWNYTFTIGYDAPLSDYVKTKDRRYVLAVPFLTPLRDVAVDEVHLRIRLPEGARHVEVIPPFIVDSLSAPETSPLLSSKGRTGYDYTYLDSTGRPTVLIEKKNCGDRHGSDVLITYSLPAHVDFLQKPLAVGCVVFAGYLVTIIARRSKYSISS